MSGDQRTVGPGSPPDPEVQVPAGRGAELAGWAIAAIEGRDAAVSDDPSDPGAERRQRRVMFAVAALSVHAPTPNVLRANRETAHLAAHLVDGGEVAGGETA